MPTRPPPRGWLTAEQAAERLNQTPQTVRRWCREGRFPGAKRPGRQWLIPEEDVRIPSVIARTDGVERSLIAAAALVRDLRSGVDPETLHDPNFEIAFDWLWKEMAALRNRWPTEWAA